MPRKERGENYHTDKDKQPPRLGDHEGTRRPERSWSLNKQGQTWKQRGADPATAKKDKHNTAKLESQQETEDEEEVDPGDLVIMEEEDIRHKRGRSPTEDSPTQTNTAKSSRNR